METRPGMDLRTPLWIALAGAVPFVWFSIYIAFEWTSDVPYMLHLLLSYSAVMFAFLAGAHWGFAILHARENPSTARIMMYESAGAALLAFLITTISTSHLQLLAFAFLYAFIWGIDSLLYNNKIIPLWFFNVRGIVTPIVVVSMYVAYFSVI